MAEQKEEKKENLLHIRKLNHIFTVKIIIMKPQKGF
jgi:hypothetical protein